MTHTIISNIATLMLVANLAARIPSAATKLVESTTSLLRAATRLRREVHRYKNVTRKPEKW